MSELQDLKKIELLRNRALDEKLRPVKEELSSISLKIDAIEEKLGKIDSISDEDATLELNEVEKIKIRIAELEKNLKVQNA